MPKASPVKPASPTRPQHERAFALIRLIKEKRFPNASTFVKELEVDRRTILRDLDYLRDRMGIPIEYDKAQRGYYLSAPVENIPLLEVRESDLLWLFVGQHLLQQAGSDELANLVRESFQRISGLFGSKITVRWDQLSEVISSKVAGLGAAEIAHLIRERKWHPSQKITTTDDGGLILHLKVNAFMELSNWICSWGPLMEVLEPKELRQIIGKRHRDAARVYGLSA